MDKGRGNMASITAPEGLHFGDEFSFEYTLPKKDNQYWLMFKAFAEDGTLIFSDVRAASQGSFGYGVPFQAGPSMRWPLGAAHGRGELGHQARRGFVIDADCDFEIAE